MTYCNAKRVVVKFYRLKKFAYISSSKQNLHINLITIMKKLLGCLAMAIMALMLTGCGISSHVSSNVNNNVTNVVLQDNNYDVVKSVESEVSQSYVFGIGGLSAKALRNNAVSELTKKANLQGSQALINVTVHEDYKFAFIWAKRTVRASGTVVEFK